MDSALNIEHRNFWNRFVSHGTVGWIACLLMYGFLWNYGTRGILLSSAILIMVIIQSTIGAKYQLVNFKREGDAFEFKVYKFNQLLTLKIPLNELNLTWKPLFVKGNYWKINFYQNDQFLFHQKSFGQWSVPMLQQLFKDIYTEQERKPTVDEKILADWW